MTKPSSSPQRHTFQKTAYIQRCKDEGKEPDSHMIQIYDSFANRDQYESIPENDLEYDLRTTDWILDKVRNSDAYAQNLYAAMCNNNFQRLELWPILKDDVWHCSWRYAGGIIADMREQGDYIDWYCSGSGGLGGLVFNPDDETFDQWQAKTKYVSESHVTEEIAEDLRQLGWIVLTQSDDH